MIGKDEVGIVWSVLPRNQLIEWCDDRPTARPGVEWWYADYADDMGRMSCTRHELKDFTRIDGKMWQLFTDDVKWKKLPKGYNYNTDLIQDRRTVDPERERALAEMSKMDAHNNGDLMACIMYGWLVPADSRNQMNVTTEIKGHEFRLVRGNVTANGSRGPAHQMIPAFKLYHTYEEAMTAAEAACAEIIREQEETLALDRLDDLERVIYYLPEEHRNPARMILENLPWEFTTHVRYYGGKVLYRRGGSMTDDFVCVYDTKGG